MKTEWGVSFKFGTMTYRTETQQEIQRKNL